MALTMARPLSHCSSPYADGPIWKYAPRYSDDPTWKSLPKKRVAPSALDNGLGGQSLRSVQSRCPISSWERPLGSTPLPGHILSRDRAIDDRFVDEVALRRATGHSISPFLDGPAWSRGARPLRSYWEDDLILDRRARATYWEDDALLARRGFPLMDDPLCMTRSRYVDDRQYHDDALLARRGFPLMDDPLCMTRSRYVDDRQYISDPLWAPASKTLHDPLWRHSALDGRLLCRSTSARGLP